MFVLSALMTWFISYIPMRYPPSIFLIITAATAGMTHIIHCDMLMAPVNRTVASS